LEPNRSGPVKLLAGHTGTVQSAHFSADGKRLLTCGHYPAEEHPQRVAGLIGDFITHATG